MCIIISFNIFMQYFLYLLTIPFLYFNFKIVLSDLKFKIIPNKYLAKILYMLPIWYAYLILWWTIIVSDVWFIILQIFLSFIISFWLYAYGIWSAWDAKYLLVLSLFIPHVWTLTFIWNIALLTLTYLLLYFIYFYIWKCILQSTYRKSLYWNIFNDIKEIFQYKLQNKTSENYKQKIIYKISLWVINFFVIFIIFRLLRIATLNWLYSSWTDFSIISTTVSQHSTLVVLLLIIIVLWAFYVTKKIMYFFKRILHDFFWTQSKYLYNWVLLLSLSCYMLYEYAYHPLEITQSITLIFTVYLSIYLFIIILKYASKITFQLWEEKSIQVRSLKKWDIIDKVYLKNVINNVNHKNKKTVDNYKEALNIINNSSYQLTVDDVKKIQSIIKQINTDCSTDRIMASWFQSINNIKVMNTFSFWWYIWSGFMLSVFLWSYFSEKIVLSLQHMFRI